MIPDWQYHEAIKLLASAERRYAELLSCVSAISDSVLDGRKDKEEHFQLKLKTTIERHKQETET